MCVWKSSQPEGSDGDGQGEREPRERLRKTQLSVEWNRNGCCRDPGVSLSLPSAGKVRLHPAVELTPDPLRFSSVSSPDPLWKNGGRRASFRTALTVTGLR